MRQLVREHALELVVVEDPHDALGHRDRRVLRVAAGGEGIGRVGRDDVDARHRDLRTRRQPAHDRVQSGRLGLVDGLSTVHREDDLVREPIGDEVHERRHHEADDHALLAGDRSATEDEESREDAQEETGLQHVGHRGKA